MLEKITRLKRRRERIGKSLKKSGFWLTLSRSNKFLFAQIIDAEKGKTILGLSDKSLVKKDVSKLSRAEIFGEDFAKQAIEKGIKEVSFNRGGCLFHGRVKAFADGARKGGLVF